jgi:17beta-estradiol 17-dehydrogenase / very-long-chain 3-oxoacyl-CoA reductase
MMTKLVIPQMMNKKRGLIVNISSELQNQPNPKTAAYSAAKSYTRNFTLALRKELASFNIKVQLLVPAIVCTKMTKSFMISDKENTFTVANKNFESGNWLYPNASTYVKAAIGKIGKCSSTSGYFYHSLQVIQFILISND